MTPPGGVPLFSLPSSLKDSETSGSFLKRGKSLQEGVMDSFSLFFVSTKIFFLGGPSESSFQRPFLFFRSPALGKSCAGEVLSSGIRGRSFPSSIGPGELFSLLVSEESLGPLRTGEDSFGVSSGFLIFERGFELFLVFSWGKFPKPLFGRRSSGSS